MYRCTLHVLLFLSPLSKYGLLNTPPRPHLSDTNQTSLVDSKKKMERTQRNQPNSGTRRTTRQIPLQPREAPAIMPVTMKQIKDAINAAPVDQLVINHTIISTVGHRVLFIIVCSPARYFFIIFLSHGYRSGQWVGLLTQASRVARVVTSHSMTARGLCREGCGGITYLIQTDL